MSAISDFYDVLRLLLGDNDPEGVYVHTDAALTSAVRAVFRLGRAPAGYALNGGNILPDVADGNAFARVAYEAALMLVGGEEVVSHRTRALSVTRSGQRQKELLAEFRLRIGELDGAGNGFASAQSVTAWLREFMGLMTYTGTPDGSGYRPPWIGLREISGVRTETWPPDEAAPATQNPAAPASFEDLIGGAAQIDVVHGLGSRAVTVQLVEVATGEYVTAEIAQIDADTVRVTFSTAPDAGAIRIIVQR